MRIVGTAGHVDHGKSALVISLTGHDPDRWAEERERGMTLDLGFAPLRFDDGLEAGVVDVPGHERFLHNMLAGAAGMDVLLLVVDAVEGPRRQTLEHLAILDFLNVQRAIAVLTKADLVDADGLAAAAALVRDACAGTIAQGAPVIAVSNVTGSGIAELKAAIHDALAALPERRVDAPAYLPVDRVFALAGHGTIVTGTLMQGTIGADEALVLQPSGQRARIRSLQVFGRPVARVTAGTRVAVNLPGIETDSIARGEVLAAPEFAPSTQVQVRFTPLPESLPLLRRRTPVRVHVGSAEIPGRLVLDARPPTYTTSALARIELSRPTVFYPGIRMVLRRMSPKDLLGGAVAVNAAEHVTVDADEKNDDAVAVDLHGRPPRSPEDDQIMRAIAMSGELPQSLQQIASAANLTIAIASTAIARLIESGDVVEIAKPNEYLSRAAFDGAFARAGAALADRHAQSPWRLGCTTAEIAAGIGAPDPLAARLLAAWHDDGRIGHRARAWHLPDFTPTLTADQRKFFESVLAGDKRTLLLPASHDAILHQAAESKTTGLIEALDSLVATGAIVKIGDDLYRRSQMTRAREAVGEILQKNLAGATMAQLRDALGTSRRYALPLMEYFDTIGFTVRDGDLRRLRATAGKSASPVQV